MASKDNGFQPDDDDRSSRRFDPRTENPTTAVIETVEEHSGVDATELPPLSDSVDPDSLNNLVTSPSGSQDDVLTVTFTYAGYRVAVHSDGLVGVVADDAHPDS